VRDLISLLVLATILQLRGREAQFLLRLSEFVRWLNRADDVTAFSVSILPVNMRIIQGLLSFLSLIEVNKRRVICRQWGLDYKSRFVLALIEVIHDLTVVLDHLLGSPHLILDPIL